MSYEFNLEQPTNVAFGPTTIRRLGEILPPHSNIALVCGSNTLYSNGTVEYVTTLIRGSVTSIQIESQEPTIESVDELTKTLSQESYDYVIALGGGSTLDSVKASAALTTQTPSDSVLAYLEGIGRGKKLTKPGIPTILIPTTAGTGTEATKNAVIYSPEHQVKKSLRSSLLFPHAVIIDPTLQASCKKHTTINSGMDAITQCFESYVSIRATEYTRTLARHGFKLGILNIIQAVDCPNDLEARTAMAHCAFNSGIALANGGLGVAHGISAALCSAARLSHGEACAILLPFAAKLNYSSCPDRYLELANAVGLSDGQTLIDRICQIVDQLGVKKSITEIGIEPKDVPSIVERSYGNSMSGNPFRPEPDYLAEQLLNYYA